MRALMLTLSTVGVIVNSAQAVVLWVYADGAGAASALAGALWAASAFCVVMSSNYGR